MTLKRIETQDAPKPGGHYSQGIAHGGFLFVSGQLPIVPANGEMCDGAIEEQAQQALENMLGIVEAGGSDLSRIVKTTVYISGIELWSRVNVVYAAFFGANRPARAIVPVGELHHGAQIEIDAVAALPEG